jgi:hypothetical protein
MTELDHDDVLALSDGALISFSIEQLLENSVSKHLVDVTGLFSEYQRPADATCTAEAALVNLDTHHAVVLIACCLIPLVLSAFDCHLQRGVLEPFVGALDVQILEG